jgi:hypothetical protein
MLKISPEDKLAVTISLFGSSDGFEKFADHMTALKLPDDGNFTPVPVATVNEEEIIVTLTATIDLEKFLFFK